MPKMPKTILIVDENPAQLHALKRVINERFQHQAITSVNSDEAFHTIFSNKLSIPDLLLLDLGKNTANWLNFIRIIRKKNPHFPIIILTEYGEHEYATHAIEAGANDFLTKPVATARLGLSISNAFRIRNLQQTIGKLEQKLAAAGVYAPQQNLPQLAALSPVDKNGKIKKLRTIEDEAISFALKKCDDSMSKAARMLGIGRSTLYRKVGELERNHISRANQTTRPMITSSELEFS